MMQYFLPRSSVALGPFWPAARDLISKFRLSTRLPLMAVAPNIRGSFWGRVLGVSLSAAFRPRRHTSASSRLQTSVQRPLAWCARIWVGFILGPALGDGSACIAIGSFLDRLRGQYA